MLPAFAILSAILNRACYESICHRRQSELLSRADVVITASANLFNTHAWVQVQQHCRGSPEASCTVARHIPPMQIL